MSDLNKPFRSRLLESFSIGSKILARVRERRKSTFLIETTKLLLRASPTGLPLYGELRLLLTPELADECMLHIVDLDQIIHPVPQPQNEDLAEALGIIDVIRTGKPKYVNQVSDDRLFGWKSYYCLPLQTGSKNLGALTLIFTHSSRKMNEALLAQTRNLCDLIALSLDAALIFEAARRNIEARNELLSIASHELKNPLTSLTLQIQAAKNFASQNFQGGRASEQLNQLLRISVSEINRFSRLIDNLLDASKINAGQMLLNLEAVNLLSLLNEVSERIAKELSLSDGTIEISCCPKATGKWDRVRMDQVISNLLNNAVKYGLGKPILVTGSAQGESLRVQIRDHGIGVAKEDQQRIFRRFERAVSERQFQGLGLGLYIAQQIIRAHGGKIWVESEPGQGSTFEFEIPLEPKTKNL